MVQLEVLCSNERFGRRKGQIMKREVRLSQKEQDLELADWLYCNFDLGYIITRQLIRDKALN